MKKEAIILTVPEPCHENWTQMTPVEKGRHCQSCDKTVLDFTVMTDTQIKMHLENNKSVCGRLIKSQTERELLPTVQKKSSLWKYIALLIGFTSVSIPSFSQQLQMECNPHKMDNNYIRGKIAMDKKLPKPNSRTRTITGRVVDDSNEPLIGSSILIEGTATGTVSDLDGIFSIILPNEREYTLSISYTGFVSQIIKTDSSNFYNIILKEGELLGEVILMGGICYSDQLDNYTSENGFQTIKRRFKDLKNIISTSFIKAKDNRKKQEEISISPVNATVSNTNSLSIKTQIKKKVESERVTLFPNPTTGVFSMKIEEKINTKVQIEIISYTHQVILNKTYDLNNHGNEIELDISEHPSGMYLVNLYSEGMLLSSNSVFKVR
jgi:hypothetical protein